MRSEPIHCSARSLRLDDEPGRSSILSFRVVVQACRQTVTRAGVQQLFQDIAGHRFFALALPRPAARANAKTQRRLERRSVEGTV
ncbi:hypothetical protein N185_08265 [Sinorhizobium sp. GW3]|nr:hypothetical protein N185_08265 [Sinorhizobium sp. GW3]